MELQTKWINYEYKGQSMRAYQARPQNTNENLPGILVIHEIFGVDAYMIDVAQRIAEAGYFVIAPDLYSSGPNSISSDRLQLMKYFFEVIPAHSRMDAEERAKWPQEIKEIFEIVAPSSVFGPQPKKTDLMVQSLIGWAQYLRHEGATDVASIGFCLGGGLSFHLAARYPELKGAVIYYGDSLEPEEMKSINCPVLGFYGGIDDRITKKVPGTQEHMKSLNKEFSCRIYDQVGHAFFNDTRKSYNVKAARDSWSRTLSFFNSILGD